MKIRYSPYDKLLVPIYGIFGVLLYIADLGFVAVLALFVAFALSILTLINDLVSDDE